MFYILLFIFLFLILFFVYKSIKVIMSMYSICKKIRFSVTNVVLQLPILTLFSCSYLYVILHYNFDNTKQFAFKSSDMGRLVVILSHESILKWSQFFQFEVMITQMFICIQCTFGCWTIFDIN